MVGAGVAVDTVAGVAVDTVWAVGVDMEWEVWVDMAWVDMAWVDMAWVGEGSAVTPARHRISLAALEVTILLTRTGLTIGMTALITGINSAIAMVYQTGLLIAEIEDSIEGIGSEIIISSAENASSFSGIISSSVSISRRLATLGIRGGGIQIMPIILTMTIRRALTQDQVRGPKQVLDHKTARSIGMIWPCLCNLGSLNNPIIEARSTA
jgi:hypothetical protein